MKRRTFLTLLAATVSDRALAQATVVQTCGSVTLTPGSPHNVTIDVNGRSCQSGAASAPASVWSAADAAAANGMVLSNGGLTVTMDGSRLGSVRGIISKSSGKYYFELKSNSPSGAVLSGIANGTIDITQYLGGSASSFGQNGVSGLYVNGFTVNNAVAYTTADNDVVQIAVDIDAGKVWMDVNSAHSWFGGNPATGAASALSFVPATVGSLFPACSVWGGGSGVWTLQSTAASQKYAPPAGFTPWG